MPPLRPDITEAINNEALKIMFKECSVAMEHADQFEPIRTLPRRLAGQQLLHDQLVEAGKTYRDKVDVE